MKDTIFKYIRGLVKVAGEDDSGALRNLAMTGEGHAEVAIHDPLLPFGSVHTENLRPVFQTDAVYGLNTGLVDSRSATGGTASASDSMFLCQTGTSVGGFSVIQSRKRLRYRAGQGAICRFAGLFTTGVANSYQLMGIGHAEDGYYFGYQGTNFGIFTVKRGVREVRTLTITTGSSTAENMTVTLNDTAYTVAVTNSSNIQRQSGKYRKELILAGKLRQLARRLDLYLILLAQKQEPFQSPQPRQ